MYIIISIIAGAITVVANTLNSGLGKEIGKFQGVLVNFTAGLLVSIFYLILNFNTISGFYLIKTMPIYFLFGGFFGIGIVVLNNLIMPKIPVIYVSLLIFIGQIITGIIMDKVLTDSLSIGKIVGILLITLGLYINILIDKKETENSEVEEL